jgi:hypothetical protein
MNRDYPYDINAICDQCGHKGAYDIMGDFICDKCLTGRESNDEVTIKVRTDEKFTLGLSTTLNPTYKSELIILDDDAIVIRYTRPTPNWWRRFWYWALLGWRWRKVNKFIDKEK